VVASEAATGSAVVINTAASVDHDCLLADGVFVAPGACLGGNVRVEEMAWIGIGAVLSNGVAVGEQALVGAGGVVVTSVPGAVVVVGVPARSLRPVSEKDFHLTPATFETEET
jgi:carbonic anhydrase/acetyltransferase-like protein (isoleucine patch superfamily)